VTKPFSTVAVAVLAGIAMTGCGSKPVAVGEQAGTAPVPPAPATTRTLQAANGPLPPAYQPKPLAVKLAGTRDLIRVPFHIEPRAGLLFDLDTGRVLWRHDPVRVLPIASLTKMMTALLVDARVPRGGKVRVTRDAVRFTGSGIGLLPLGKRIGVSTMLHGLLLPSGNDAAIALAQRVDGTLKSFVKAMNAKARDLSLGCTTFATPSGLSDGRDRSCAYDLAALARAVLDRPRLARIVARRSAFMAFPIRGGRLFLYNNNPLLIAHYPGTLGIKTGYTIAAGHCLVAAAKRDGHRLGVILLHSPGTGPQAIKLLDRGFEALKSER
jgi:serine-type D-Ala-D-Ala carboxypeptidase (penicillin-binding protein 5/6)